MAKIGPPLPPQVPRTRAPEPSGPGPRGPQAPSTPAALQPQQVVQQFSTALTSAGKLATQLVKGLLTGNTPASSRSTDKSASREEPEAAGPRAADEGPTPRGLLGAAFAALRRARQERAQKRRRKKAGRAGAARALDAYYRLEEEGEEELASRSEMRTWLRGEDTEENTFEQARREARRLEELDRQGEPPSLILSQLNGQLGGDRSPRFKRQLIEAVRPRLELLAERVGQVPTEERRKVAALVARALHQAGAQNAATFDKLLAATVTAEVDHLAGSTAPVSERAADFAQALRGAASPAFRAALLEKGQGFLEALGRDAAGASPEGLQEVLACLLRAGEGLAAPSATAMAEAFVTGVRGAGRSGATEALATGLAPALRAVPGGGLWALQVYRVLGARGEQGAAQRLGEVLEALLREARERGLPALQALRTHLAQRKGREQEPELLRRLEETGALGAMLVPTCGAMYALREQLPPGLSAEALLVLGMFDLVSGSAPGQRVLRQALLAQERGEWTFLSIVPQVAQGLSQPTFQQALQERGLSSAAYASNQGQFVLQVGTQTARALSVPVVALSQKGEAGTARALLRSGLHFNAALFGLGAEGMGMALGLFEELRARPKPQHAQRLIQKLHELARKYPPADRSGSVGNLRGLVMALANRDPEAAPREVRVRTHNEDALKMSSLAVEALQVTRAREQAMKRAGKAEQKAADAPPGEARAPAPGTSHTRPVKPR